MVFNLVDWIPFSISCSYSKRRLETRVKYLFVLHSLKKRKMWGCSFAEEWTSNMVDWNFCSNSIFEINLTLPKYEILEKLVTLNLKEKMIKILRECCSMAQQVDTCRMWHCKPDHVGNRRSCCCRGTSGSTCLTHPARNPSSGSNSINNVQIVKL